jgi:hypothetical protein
MRMQYFLSATVDAHVEAREFVHHSAPSRRLHARNVCSEQVAFLVNVLNDNTESNERDNAVISECGCLMHRMHQRADCKYTHEAESNKQ